MKLKTEFQDEDFKLGEVADVNIATMPDGRIKAQAVAKSGGVHTFFYDDLKTFADDWEDYEEPSKTIWQIKDSGELQDFEEDVFSDGYIESSKSIGNYFDSREEAEKAVEKLKAWKRLKDKGFSFDGYDVAHNSNGDLCGQLFYNAGDYCIEDVEKDLDICFGGEE